jgi:hypothetical protein
MGNLQQKGIIGLQFVARDFREFIRLSQKGPHLLIALLPAKQRQTGALPWHHAKTKASAPKLRFAWRRPNASWPTSLSTTTPLGCTLQSATSLHWIAWARRHKMIFAARDKKLEAPNEARKLKRQQQLPPVAKFHTFIRTFTLDQYSSKSCSEEQEDNRDVLTFSIRY